MSVDLSYIYNYQNAKCLWQFWQTPYLNVSNEKHLCMQLFIILPVGKLGVNLFKVKLFS